MKAKKAGGGSKFAYNRCRNGLQKLTLTHLQPKKEKKSASSDLFYCEESMLFLSKLNSCRVKRRAVLELVGPVLDALQVEACPSPLWLHQRPQD